MLSETQKNTRLPCFGGANYQQTFVLIQIGKLTDTSRGENYQINVLSPDSGFY